MRKQIHQYDSMKAFAFTIVSLLFLTLSASGQNTQYTSAAESDPAALAILQQLRQKYDGYSSFQADYSLTIELPEQPAEVQKGTLARQGDKYHMKMSSQEVISDGKALYLILHNNQEVQINDLPEEGEDQSILSPQALLNLYESDKFVYTLTNELDRNGTVVQQIEMKPLDKYADYSKVRMEVDKKRNEVLNVIAFGKDGSRFTFTLDKVMPNKSFSSAHFTFDKAKYPEYYVEDLRY